MANTNNLDNVWDLAEKIGFCMLTTRISDELLAHARWPHPGAFGKRVLSFSPTWTDTRMKRLRVTRMSV